MSFASWCACHAFDVRQRLESRYWLFMRRRCLEDARAFHRAFIAQCLSEINPRIARELQGLDA